MKNILLNPTPLRQKFIEHLTLNRKAERTVHSYVSFIYSLAKFYKRSPDQLKPDEIQHWLYHLIAQRKQAPSTVGLAINAVRTFYGGLLQQDIERTLKQVKRPKRPAKVPRPYSTEGMPFRGQASAANVERSFVEDKPVRFAEKAHDVGRKVAKDLNILNALAFPSDARDVHRCYGEQYVWPKVVWINMK